MQLVIKNVESFMMIFSGLCRHVGSLGAKNSKCSQGPNSFQYFFFLIGVFLILEMVRSTSASACADLLRLPAQLEEAQRKRAQAFL